MAAALSGTAVSATPRPRLHEFASRRKRIVSSFEILLLVLTLTCVLLGGLSICCARTHPDRGTARWGRRGFLLVLLGLGATILVAAVVRADGLAPLGLVAGLLVAGMLWESPAPYRQAPLSDEV
jgi:hypothetical protein